MHVHIKGSPYEPAQKQQIYLSIFPKKLFCSHIKRVEQLLFDYKKERCRLASFVYHITKHITVSNDALKRVAIAMKKERFRIDKFKEMHCEIERRLKHFDQIVHCRWYITIFAVCLVLLYSVGTTVYPMFSTLPNSSLYLLMLSISIAVMPSFAIFILLIHFVLRIEKIYKKRMKRLTAIDCPTYFASIYNKLQFVRKEGELFLYDILYDIEEGVAAEEDKAYHLARYIYKANESRASICKGASDPLLAERVSVNIEDAL